MKSCFDLSVGWEVHHILQALRVAGMDPTARIRRPCKASGCKGRHSGMVHHEHKESIDGLAHKLGYYVVANEDIE